jgi:hypothetical protein
MTTQSGRNQATSQPAAAAIGAFDDDTTTWERWK